MTGHDAIFGDLAGMTVRQLDFARSYVGNTKLMWRRALGWQKAIDKLRPLNERIDQINEEDHRRQRRRP